MKGQILIGTTALQRELTVFGLELQHKLATDTSGNLKRLDRAEKITQDVLGTNAFLTEKLDGLADDDAEGDAQIDITPMAAKVWQNALVLIARSWARLDRSLTKAKLVPHREDRQQSLQQLVDQLHNALDLPLVNIDSLGNDDVPEDAQHATDPVDDDQLEISGTVGATSGKAPPKKGRRGAATAEAFWDQGKPEVDPKTVKPLALNR